MRRHLAAAAAAAAAAFAFAASVAAQQTNTKLGPFGNQANSGTPFAFICPDNQPIVDIFGNVSDAGIGGLQVACAPNFIGSPVYGALDGARFRLPRMDQGISNVSVWVDQANNVVRSLGYAGQVAAGQTPNATLVLDGNNATLQTQLSTSGCQYIGISGYESSLVTQLTFQLFCNFSAPDIPNAGTPIFALPGADPGNNGSTTTASPSPTTTAGPAPASTTASGIATAPIAVAVVLGLSAIIVFALWLATRRYKRARKQILRHKLDTAARSGSGPASGFASRDNLASGMANTSWTETRRHATVLVPSPPAIGEEDDEPDFYEGRDQLGALPPYAPAANAARSTGRRESRESSIAGEITTPAATQALRSAPLEPQPASEATLAAEQDPLAPSVTNVQVQGPRAANAHFIPSQSDEIALNVGDVLTVLAVYSDGWAFVRNTSAGTQGLVPITCIDAQVSDVELVQMQQAMLVKGVISAVQGDNRVRLSNYPSSP
ncbi:hypothetical protein RI367_002880 [Sorochytrium milnesiophthora]